MRITLLVFLAACSAKPTPPPPATWAPGALYPTPRGPTARGLLDRKGLIHAHSAFSHDACDGQPRSDAGVYDEACFTDFRRDACAALHDFVFLTDHGDSFIENEFPAVLLYRPSENDELVSHGAGPTANRITCPDGRPLLLMAGSETGRAMPVGLERHLGTATSRAPFYDGDERSLLDVQAAGGVALIAHTEDYTPSELISMKLDGFEMFNLHRNTLQNVGIAAELIIEKVSVGDFEGLPHPDAFFTAFTLDDATYASTWGTVLARGTKRVTTMGTDCHRNTFKQPLQDGERVDSYRRMMSMFSNHLLVTPNTDGHVDDRALKAALKARRLYGTFEFLGQPDGFDFFAKDGDATFEQGDVVKLSPTLTLEATTPRVRDLDPAAPAPTITTKLLKAKEGGWDVVAESTSALRFTPTTPGAYRVEVRIVPAHLRPFIGKRGDFLRGERPWVLSNALFVEP